MKTINKEDVELLIKERIFPRTNKSLDNNDYQVYVALKDGEEITITGEMPIMYSKEIIKATIHKNTTNKKYENSYVLDFIKGATIDSEEQCVIESLSKESISFIVDHFTNINFVNLIENLNEYELDDGMKNMLSHIAFKIYSSIHIFEVNNFLNSININNMQFAYNLLSVWFGESPERTFNNNLFESKFKKFSDTTLNNTYKSLTMFGNLLNFQEVSDAFESKNIQQYLITKYPDENIEKKFINDRILSYTRILLYDNQNQGISYLKTESVIRTVMRKLNIDSSTVIKLFTEEEGKVINLSDSVKYEYPNNDTNISQDYDVAITEKTIFAYSVFSKELTIVDTLEKLSKLPDQPILNNFDKLYKKYVTDQNITLDDTQKQVLTNMNNKHVFVLTGQGGSGKTFVTSIFIKMLKDADITKSRLILLASTGRASKVLSHYSKFKATTIHKTFELRSANYINDVMPHGNYPSAAIEPIFIIDESSMITTDVMEAVLKCYGKENLKQIRFIFIGDDKQLPPVGSGNFFHDILNQDEISKTKLLLNHRSNETGKLNEILNNINDKSEFYDKLKNGNNFFGDDLLIVNLFNTKTIHDASIHMYQQLLNRDGISYNDIYFLTPTNKGVLGTMQLNKELQSLVNPPSDDKKEVVSNNYNNLIFREGDPIVIQQNMSNQEYSHEIDKYGEFVKDPDEDVYKSKFSDVFNGDQGIIVTMNDFSDSVIVKIDDKYFAIPKNKAFTKMGLGYVSTVHKAQGGEAKFVIFVTASYMSYQLNSNLINTALSRSKTGGASIMYISDDMLRRSIKKNVQQNKQTFFKAFAQLNNFRELHKSEKAAKAKETAKVKDPDKLEDSTKAKE